MYRNWFDSGTNYLAQTMLLAGVDPEKVIERFPRDRGALKQSGYTSDFEMTIGVNKFRRRLLEANTREEYLELREEILRFLSLQAPKLRLPVVAKEVLGKPGGYSKEAICRALIDALHSALLWKLPMLAERYPQYLPLRYLRNLFLGFSRESIAVYRSDYLIDDEFMEGAFLPLPKEKVLSWTCDADMFNSLVPWGDTYHWPETAIQEATVAVGEANKTYHILVDGENVHPSVLESFMWNQLSPVDGCDVRVCIVGPAELHYLWEPFMYRSVHDVEYIAIKPIRAGKSRVDFALCQKANDLYYRSGAREMCIVSSDSDFSILLETLEGVSWLFALERGLICEPWVAMLKDSGTRHIFFDRSFMALNKSIYERHMIAYFGVREETLNIDDDTEWFAFLERFGFSPEWRPQAVVREVTRSRRAERANKNFIEEGKVDYYESNGSGSDQV